jgi:uncharacterized protein YjeT (DUF2065 family)
LTSTRRSGSLGLLVRVVFVCFAISASAPSHYTVLSDRHLAQSGLCPIVSGLCPIVTWLSQVSVRSVRSLSDRHLAQSGLCPVVSGLCPIVTWPGRVSVRSSFGSAWSLSDRAGSLSDRHLAQPGLCPIVPGLCPIVILLSLFLRVVCRWPDSFCDQLIRSSFVVDLSSGLSSTIPGFRCGS